ncbi:phosphoenolpyruvate carboxykinase (ATP) [Acidobacteriota bacterium]
MQQRGNEISKYGLENHGIRNIRTAYWNLSTPELYEEAIRRREGIVAHLGPISVRTGYHTGRSPKDKFLVKEPSSQEKIWWGKVNIAYSEERFKVLYHRILAYLQTKDLFVQDVYAGADQKYSVPVRVINEDAWHNLFVRNMFVRPPWLKRPQHVPDFTILHVPHFHADPELDQTNSEAFVIPHFGKKLVLIGGTCYAGEIKKSIFSVLHYLLPQEDVLSMHCSANVGSEGDVALFFGLSGTGKTTLSADVDRRLIGDDEHGWSNNGVFNFEGGCYAKVIRLSEESEPQIFECTRRFGTILENVGIDPETRRLDLNDDSLTENTRAAYPISHIENSVLEGEAGHPSNVILLTLDAFGVLPPISKLSSEQAMYHFLSGYTAKVAGTEKGMGDDPIATFSACFGAPFLALHPTVYADLLGKRISDHKVDCWLVNTGWTGGSFGVGSRMKIAHTRAMVRAALSGKLKDVEYEKDPVFGVMVPKSCPDVPSEVLNQKATWSDKGAYDAKARELASRFHKNFEEFSEAGREIRDAGPILS